MRLIIAMLIMLPLLTKAQSGTTQNDPVYTIVQQMPTFNGDLPVYLSQHVTYPKDVIAQGTVVVSFIVEKDGSLSNIQVIQSVQRSLDSTAVACVLHMPKWIPGMQNGAQVRVKYNLPIGFSQPVIEKSSQNPDTPPRVK